jgi:hypothetical protein
LLLDTTITERCVEFFLSLVTESHTWLRPGFRDIFRAYAAASSAARMAGKHSV